MRRPVVVCVAVAFVLTASAWGQDDRVRTGQDMFERATVALVTWLKNITGALDPIVAKENRVQFRARLRELNKSLHDVESAKAAYIQSLERGRSPRPEDLVLKVDTLKGDVRKVAVLLREEHAKGGSECEELLSSATGERKLWLYELASNFPALDNEMTRRAVIEQGKRAIRSLREASLELAKLTRRLNEP
jgi:hypothetical protein